MKTTVPILNIHLEPVTILMKNTESLFGEVVHAYTRKQAIADGFQVETFPASPAKPESAFLSLSRAPRLTLM